MSGGDGVVLREQRGDHDGVANMPVRETHLFSDPVTRSLSRWRPPRWGVVTGVVVLGLVALVLSAAASLVDAVHDRDVRRDRLKASAERALPAGSLAVTTGFISTRTAYAIADLAAAPPEVLAGFGARWGEPDWHEIPDTATRVSRSYLSAGKDRILEVWVKPCMRHRDRCPRGGSTVTVEVGIGGPNS